jgi:hypothetical protein
VVSRISRSSGEKMPATASSAGPTTLAFAGAGLPAAVETMYQFRAAFVVDSSKFETTFGRLESTPHREAVAQTVAWYQSR